MYKYFSFFFPLFPSQNNKIILREKICLYLSEHLLDLIHY